MKYRMSFPCDSDAAVAYIASFVIREKGKDLAGLTLKTLKH